MEKVLEIITLYVFYCDSCPFTENELRYFITTFQSASIRKHIFSKYSMCILKLYNTRDNYVVLTLST